MNHNTSFLEKVLSNAPESLDLRDAGHSGLLMRTVKEILARYPALPDIQQLENDALQSEKGSNIFYLLALKLAKAKISLRQIAEPVHISVVFAVYKEHNRIKKSSEHAHGEDFLRRKVAQLDWLTAELPNVSWELIVVDDGCPEKSGNIAQEIVEREQLGDRVRVLFLSDAIERKLPPAAAMNATNESQKGGSIIYGMWHAIQGKRGPNDIVVFTDADLSTHLGQIGLLVEPIVEGNKAAAIGSRREADSVVIKKGTRNTRGKLFIYLWKRLLPDLGHIIDTQCGFKAFRRKMVKKIIGDLIEMKFAFDIELLLKTEKEKRHSIEKVGIAWIDSEEASTTTDLQPYLSMLKSIVKMYRKYLEPTEKADEFAGFIESMNEDRFNELLDNIPLAITSREPSEFTDFDDVTVAVLAAGISD